MLAGRDVKAGPAPPADEAFPRIRTRCRRSCCRRQPGSALRILRWLDLPYCLTLQGGGGGSSSSSW